MRLRKKPWIEEAMQDLKGEYVLMHDLENYKGRWQELFPGKRLCLEIGCGKGRFIIGMAELSGKGFYWCGNATRYCLLSR